MKTLKYIFLVLFLSLISPVSWSAEQGNSLAAQADWASQFITDSTITAAVKTDLLMDKDITSLSIAVSTDKGVVTLKGNVENELQKQKAVEIANKVTGVKSVRDDLLIQSMSQSN